MHPNVRRLQGLRLWYDAEVTFIPLGFLIFTCAVSVVGIAPGAAAAPRRPLVVALGDSITYGWSLPHPATQNYAASYARRVGGKLVNLAVPGFTCAQVRLTLSKMPPNASTVVLNCGTNDIGGFGATHGGLPNGHHRIAPATPTELSAAEKDFRDIISIVRKKESRARIIAITIRSWQRMTGPEDPRFAEDVSAWNAMIRATRVHVADIAADSRMYNPGFIQEDLIHPNVAGNAAIADDVFAALSHR